MKSFVFAAILLMAASLASAGAAAHTDPVSHLVLCLVIILVLAAKFSGVLEKRPVPVAGFGKRGEAATG